MDKKPKTQRVLIPKGALPHGETAIIEIPKRYLKSPVVIVKRRPGIDAKTRAAMHFVKGPPNVQNTPECDASCSTGPQVYQQEFLQQLKNLQNHRNIMSQQVQAPASQKACQPFCQKEYRPPSPVCPSANHLTCGLLGLNTASGCPLQHKDGNCAKTEPPKCPGSLQAHGPHILPGCSSFKHLTCDSVASTSQNSCPSQKNTYILSKSSHPVCSVPQSPLLQGLSACPSLNQRLLNDAVKPVVTPKCPGQLTMNVGGCVEQNLFKQSIDELQKARRQFLKATQLISEKLSNMSFSSSDEE